MLILYHISYDIEETPINLDKIMNNLRKARRVAGVAILIFATLIFLDFTGSIHQYLGWVAKVQLIPAIFALNFVVVAVLLIATLIFGRLYCSVVCPLGLFQDGVSRIASAVLKRRKFTYSKPKNILRYSLVALFIVAAVAGAGSIVALLEPYGTFGVMVSNILAPIYRGGNNLLAIVAEQLDSYAIYNREVVIHSVGVTLFALAMTFIIGGLAWRNGRSYCNTICPVGTILGVMSKFSLLKINIDHSKCNGCRKCVRECKSSSISEKEREIDYTRCVVCFNCIESCKQGAVSYGLRKKTTQTNQQPTIESNATSKSGEVDNSRRNMLTISATLLATSMVKAEGKLVDGGLAVIEDKKIPQRDGAIVPPGAYSLRNFASRCTGCQLCVSVCPNDVLRPATGMMNFMQPHMSFERGYCRPECTKCSEVCPTGAINKIDRADKSSIQIGHAVWIEKNCVVLTDGATCDNCATHCPVNAIRMVVANDKEKYEGRKIPIIDTERCIGCGACEHLCPARPFSAIYVEGHSMHKNI